MEFDQDLETTRLQRLSDRWKIEAMMNGEADGTKSHRERLLERFSDPEPACYVPRAPSRDCDLA